MRKSFSKTTKVFQRPLRTYEPILPFTTRSACIRRWSIRPQRRCISVEHSDLRGSQEARLERSSSVSRSRRRSQLNEETNWLHGERIACPSCQQPLYRVDHSPFYDEHLLYCDRCPIRVEVSFYDPVYHHLTQTLSRDGGEKYTALM